MTKHPIEARQIGLHGHVLNLRGGQVSRPPCEVLLISRVQAKLLITSRKCLKAGENSRSSVSERGNQRYRRPARPEQSASMVDVEDFNAGATFLVWSKNR